MQPSSAGDTAVWQQALHVVARPSSRCCQPSTRAPSSIATHVAGAKRRANSPTRRGRPSCRRRRACGNGTMPRREAEPDVEHLGTPVPCGGESWNSTMRSVSAIAPADHATTVRRRNSDRHAEKRSRLSSDAT